MTWQPQQQGLQELLTLLRNTNSHDNSIQAQVQEKLQQYKNVPDFNNYLIYILTQLKAESDNVRAIAGILLKNNIRLQEHQMHADALEYLKQACLSSIGDQMPLVRNTITSIITTIVSQIGLNNWSQLLPTLLQHMDCQDYNLIEGAFGALEKILEDSGQEFVKPQLQESSIFIAQKLIQMSDSPAQKIRIQSLHCYNLLIEFRVPAAVQRIQDYIQALSRRATDQVGEVRAEVCRAFVHILDGYPEVLLPCLSNVAEFMFFAAQDENSDVALDACEFWLAFAEHEELKDNLEALIPRLLPVLTKNMVYSEYDIQLLSAGDEEDELVPDRQQDIKPRHYKAKTHTTETTRGDDDDDDDDNDEEDEELYAEWNLRKCSAATLDVLSNVFGNEILPHLLPLLQHQLSAQEWQVKEAGVLALGAIAEGCMVGIMPHLPQLIPFLFQTLKDPKSLLRSISCWTLSRYAGWALSHDLSLFFEPMLKGLLEAVLDRNKRVQEAGCSALATVEEEADDRIIPYCPHIIPVLVEAFGRYQSRNLLILYDAIGTLAESAGNSLATGPQIQMLMSPLIAKWNQLSDEDTGLFPLLECLSAVAIAFGQSFAPFAPPVYDRCLRLIKSNLDQQVKHDQNPQHFDAPDKDFVVVALDLVSGIVQALGPEMGVLFQQHQQTLFQVLILTMQDNSDDVRQSSFALMGDLAINCFDQLQPHLPQYLPLIVQHTHPRSDMSISAANNACWAAGEISLRYHQSQMQAFVPALLERLIPILNHPEMPRTLRENAAITIGRLSIGNPEIVAPALNTFGDNWCKCLRTTRDNNEKESAYLGFCNLIRHNPEAAFSSFPIFCETIAFWHTPSPNIASAFKDILHFYKARVGDSNWATLKQSLSAETNHRLAHAFGV